MKYFSYNYTNNLFISQRQTNKQRRLYKNYLPVQPDHSNDAEDEDNEGIKKGYIEY